MKIGHKNFIWTNLRNHTQMQIPPKSMQLFVINVLNEDYMFI